ncbi:MAG: stage IV sporulation protein A [Clostridia bacterium]|nr:stage IV sporulation protein A [Clostridia bacterium]
MHIGYYSLIDCNRKKYRNKGERVQMSIYQDIASRCGGDVYIGVIGPVRTGKSTLIKRFMETTVLPNIESPDVRERTRDEIPQTASGKTVMTTEPKFIPDTAVDIALDDNAHFKVKMIDCVGYMTDGAQGLVEEGETRLVMTPWSSEPMPFDEAAELGTRKVIREHSTIGLMVTSDGTIGDIGREAYEEAENRVIAELRASGKPFVIILNSAYPDSDGAVELAFELEKRHRVPVALVNCLELDDKDIKHILELVLFEFPVVELEVDIPKWISKLSSEHPIRTGLGERLRKIASQIRKIADVRFNFDELFEWDDVEDVTVDKTDLGCGKSKVRVKLSDSAFYRALGESIGMEIGGEGELMDVVRELGEVKNKYGRVIEAMKTVEEKGYGIVVPDVDDLHLEEPEIIKQAGGYGVKLRASADSIHMIRAKIKTEVNPIVGSEKQSEEMVKFLLNEFEENPSKIWESNMFGKSLYELVNEGLNTKLEHMPDESREKLAGALQRIVNEGSRGLICVIL